MSDHPLVADRFRRFAEVECHGNSPHYETLSRGLADDADLIAFIAEMPITQPNLFFAAVQFLTGPEDMPRTGAEMKAFVFQEADDVGRLMRSRRTQTNEVGRCATILPALPRGPLALLEVGASAGLCLLLDRYGYDFDGRRLGDDASPVQLSCAVQGAIDLANTLPEIAWRGGLDLFPVDLQNDDDDVRWLLACVWPDHPERRQRLTAAIELAKADQPMIRRGDLTRDLSALLADIPRDALLVVFHSAAMAYVSDEGRRAFIETLREHSLQREIVWISNEARRAVPEITALAPPGGQFPFLLGRTCFLQGQQTTELLGIAHPHGHELEWLADITVSL